MIYLQNARFVDPNQYDECWIITRSIAKLPANIQSSRPYRHVPSLAPDPALFNKARSWMMCHTLEEEWDRYTDMFLKHITKDQMAIDALNELYHKSFTSDIAICCFCNSEKLCHRSIVAGLLLNAGALIDCDPGYAKYQWNVRS